MLQQSVSASLRLVNVDNPASLPSRNTPVLSSGILFFTLIKESFPLEEKSIIPYDTVKFCFCFVKKFPSRLQYFPQPSSRKVAQGSFVHENSGRPHCVPSCNYNRKLLAVQSVFGMVQLIVPISNKLVCTKGKLTSLGAMRNFRCPGFTLIILNSR